MLKSPTWPYPRAHGLPLPCALLNNRVRGGQVVASLKWHLTQYGRYWHEMVIAAVRNAYHWLGTGKDNAYLGKLSA